MEKDDDVVHESEAADSDEEMGSSISQRMPFRHHAATQRFLAAFPLASSIPLFPFLCSKYGIYPMGMFTLVYFMSKGLTAHIIAGTTLPVFKDYFGVDASVYQRLVAIGFMAWSMKPLIGVCSDAVTFKGFHKRWYMTASAVSSCVLLLGYAVLPGEGVQTPQWVVLLGGALLFCINYCCALLDLLPEGRYSELIALRPETSSAMVSWVWMFVMLGGGVAGLLQGPLADSGNARVSLLIACVAQACLVVPLKRNWFGERADCGDQGERRAVFRFHSNLIKENARIAWFCVLMAVVTILTAVTTMFLDNAMLLMVTLSASIIMSLASFQALPFTAALANVFMFLKQLLYIQLPGPLDYFYTADQACVPDGPHFSYFYYQTFTVVAGYAAGALGIAVFHRFFSQRSFRYTFWCTTLIKILASVVDVVMVKRWNRSVFGVSDHVTYLLGDAIVFGMCQMLDFMPAVVLTSKLCPKGMESTMYAVLAGFSNLGQALSNTTGSLLMEYVWPVRTAIPCDFSQLPTLLVVGHGVLPLLIVPLTFVMIPDSNVSDDIAESTTESREVD